MIRREDNNDGRNDKMKYAIPKNNEAIHPGTLYEALFNEQQKLLKDGNSVENADHDIAFSSSLHQTAAMIGVLKCAAAKNTMNQGKNKNEHENEDIFLLLKHLLGEKNSDVGWIQNLRKSSIACPTPTIISPYSGNDVINSTVTDDHGNKYANNFFQEYPECTRSSPILSECDESSCSSEEVDGHKYHLNSNNTHKEYNPKEDSCSSSANTNTSHNVNSNQSCNSRRRRQKISSESFRPSLSSTNPFQLPHDNNNISASPRKRNPYVDSKSITNSFDDGASTNHNSNYNRVSNVNTDIAHSNYNNNNWSDYASTNTNINNPFCTANEFVVDDNSNPKSRNNYSQYRAQNDNFSSNIDAQGNECRSQQSRQNYVNNNNNALKRPTFSAGLSKKFQLPKSKGSSSNNSGGGVASANKIPHSNNRNSSNNHTQVNDIDDELPPELSHLDKELVQKIENEILCGSETAKITFDDIAGLEHAKQMVMELVCWPMKRPDLFTGLRRGPNGLLLFGPPGTGKTLVGKAIASESGATFFSISSSSLTSKWIGEGEKLVRTLFAVAAYKEPAVVFIDEIDSLLTQRKSDENEASRRIKTEFLVQLDGTGTSGQGRVLVIGATNRPHELDDAARRRFVKRLYIPLPEKEDRSILLKNLLSKNHHTLTHQDVKKLANETEGYSGADLKALCTDAAMGPIRQLSGRISSIRAQDVPPICFKHFRCALRGMSPSVASEDLDVYVKWNEIYGNKSGPIASSSDEDEDERQG